MNDDNLICMVRDFCRKSRHTDSVEKMLSVMSSSSNLITGEGFFTYQICGDELIIVYAYVKPGVDGRAYAKVVEDIGRLNHCKYVRFGTRRSEAFAKVYPDYKPAGVIFEKELI